MTQYNLTCLFNGTWFDTFNCLNFNSNYVLLYVFLVVIFLIVMAIDYGVDRDVKNGLLLSSSITAIVAILIALGAAMAGYSQSVILNYSGAAMFFVAVASAFLIYHILSRL